MKTSMLTKAQSRMVKSNPDVRRLVEKCEINDDGCWIWSAGKVGDYGVLSYRGGSWRAHRVSYTLFCGEIPDGLFVCHHCDVPACVNPSHLFLGHASANMKDMVRKGRSKTLITSNQNHFKSGHAPRGESGSGAKITEEKAKEIIRLGAEGAFTSDIAASFGIDRTSVQRILRGETWRYLPRPCALPRKVGTHDKTSRRAALREEQSK